MLLLDVLDKILRMLPVVLIGVEGKYYGSISEGYYKLEIVLTQNGKNYSLSDIFFISN